ncbi:MAG: methyl-accepting chemotaxis protein [Lachnospiraceae bacterium]|nr:methyl-accepting chemotaxis protein [Lachnospiraceae bacterium]
MKGKSIFKQLLIPMMTIICTLAAALVVVILSIVTTSYEKDIYAKNQDISNLLSDQIASFMDGAYSVNQALAENPSILTMDTEIQTPILTQCVANNSYLDLLYIQGTDGMQTGRSSGELADRSTRWWFTQTMSDKVPFISKSYYSVATGATCTSIFFPMYQDGEMIGVYAADLKLDFLQNLIGEYSDESDGRISFVIDGEGAVVAHPDIAQIEELYNYRDLTKTVSVKDSAGNAVTDADGNIVTEEYPLEVSDNFKQVIAQVMAGNSGSTKVSYDGAAYYASYTTIPLKGESDSWSLITLHKKSAAMSMVNSLLVITIIISLVVIAVAIFIVIYLARKLTTPVVSMTELMKEASDGDFSIKADESSQNEVGQLAQSFNVMSGKISGVLVRIMDFTKELIQCSGKLQDIESNIVTISSALNEISGGTERQTADVNNVVERMGEMEDKFRELKSKSGNLLDEAEHTITSGEEGSLSINQLEEQNEHVEKNVDLSYEKIKTLETHSTKISDIVGTINSISEETELLSLNASIEAARAGEHGRGFAIVAESIGKLAAESTSATTNIEKIIEELCSDIEETVFNVEEVKKAVTAQIQATQKVKKIFHDFKKLAEQTSGSVTGIDELIEEMYEIDRSIVEAAQSIRDISQKTEDLSGDAAGSLDEEVKDVQNSVQSLTMISNELEQEMAKFKLRN